MSAVLPFIKIDSSSFLARYFTPYQICWIEAEDPFHEKNIPVCALAEKSVRIGWTFCDGFKNVRKRLRFPNRDYLFVTRDWPSALEYMNNIYKFADLLGYTRACLTREVEAVPVKRLDSEGNPTSLIEEVKVGYIRFDNGSRIIVFSSNPYAMAVYGGDVGIDEFAKHPNPKLLWQIAQGRVAWNFDLAVWSSHDGQDTLFNQFAQEARSTLAPGAVAAGLSPGAPSIQNPNSKIQNPSIPWNLYFRVTMPDAVELGLVDLINRVQRAKLTPEKFLNDCRARAGSEDIFQQAYLCNPQGDESATIVDWSAIERCRADYSIERLHLESSQILKQFGQPNPGSQQSREASIHQFLREKFPNLFKPQPSTPNPQLRLGFDVAASGQGDLAAFYIDEGKGSALWLRALFTARTEDWHFLKTVLFLFLRHLPNLQAAGDESGLGRQICWEAANDFPFRFHKVNFSSKKHDLGFTLMNQLSGGEKHFPRSEYDIATDYFALRKVYSGTKWVFTEGRNNSNPSSHCDIAWAGALATHAHDYRPMAGALVC